MNYSRFLDLLSYDKNSGSLTWNEDRGRTAKKGSIAGTKTKLGYVRVWLSGKTYPAHKIAWFLHFNQWPEYIDHINGIRDDNRISNLRLSNPVKNSRNRKRPSNNTSGCTGVYKYSDKSWQARIHDNGKTVILGMFSTFDEAKKARKDAEKLFGYSKNHDRVTSSS